MPDIEVICADAVDVVSEGLAVGFGALICDPPYSRRVHEQSVSTGTGGRGPVKREYGFGHLTPVLRSAIATAAGQVSRWTCLFSDLEMAYALRVAVTHPGREVEALTAELSCEPPPKSTSGVDYVRQAPWTRWSQPQTSGDRMMSGSEAVLMFHRVGAKHWNGNGGATHFESDEGEMPLAALAMRGKDKHPAEKPLDLMLALVSALSDAGESVLDLTAGVGTTGLAARVLGRDAMIVESDPAVAERADIRMRASLSARDLSRARRWVIEQHAWVSDGTPPLGLDGTPTESGLRRYSHALEDCLLVADQTGIRGDIATPVWWDPDWRRRAEDPPKWKSEVKAALGLSAKRRKASD